jgi:predicted CXXCH cytochrome family protein
LFALTAVSFMLAATGVGAQEQKKQERKDMPQVSERRLLEQPQLIPGLLARGQLAPKQVPNPHWRADACRACHSGPASAKNVALRDRDMNRLCNVCHETISNHSYIHPVGMRIDKDMAARMPPSFREAMKRGAGQVTCITCHDLPMQCLRERASARGLNPLFFRGGPYRDRTELCFRCHDAGQYQRLNPHDQLTDAGQPREASCLICHEDADKLGPARSIADVDFNVRGDLNALCTGCHPWIPHPGGAFSFSRTGKGPDHLTVPSREVRARMEKMERQHDIVMPLDPNTGRIFCATCHNPHERGVVKLAAAARGADSDKRLRMADMCLNCHEK